MTFASAEIEKLECKYCKVNLTEQSTNSVGFVTCPDCQRTYLKLPQTNLPERNISISQSRKKILDLFIDPSVHERALQELRTNLKAQEENIALLKSQKESLGVESDQERLILIENLKKAHSSLEEISILNQELQESLEEANFELKRVQGVISEKNQLMIKLKNELDTVSEKLRLRENLFDVLEKENGLKSSSLALVNNEFSEMKSLCATYEQKITALEHEISIDKNRLMEMNLSLEVIPDLEVELERANMTAMVLQKEIEELNQAKTHDMGIDHVAVLNEEINALKKDIQEYEVNVSELKNKLSSQNDVIKSKETEIYSLHHQTQELVKATPASLELEQANLFSNVESDEIIKLRDRVRRLEQTEQKLENIETELEISRDELCKAQKEIVGLNSLLEKAFYENQKSQVEVAPVQTEKLVHVARDIEKREDDLMEFSYEVNNKISAFLKQFEDFQSLAFDVAVIREDANGRVVSPLFSKGTLLPIGDMEIKKVISYKTTLNKGLVYFKQEDDRNNVLSSLKLDFSSNSLFFLNDEEFNALTVSEVEVEIREEYSLNSKGELSVALFRNNGFKRFDAHIGKLFSVTAQGIEKFAL